METKLLLELRCPCCSGNRIDCEDVYDVEGAYIEGEDALIEQCLGVCHDCGVHLQWERAYKFIGFRDIESIE